MFLTARSRCGGIWRPISHDGLEGRAAPHLPASAPWRVAVQTRMWVEVGSRADVGIAKGPH